MAYHSKISFVIEGEPKGKARPRFGKGKVYTPAATTSYEELVALYYKNTARGYQFTSPVFVRIHAFLKPPRKSKKVVADMLKGLVRPTKKPDLDNVAKVILDGLNKVAWEDDTQVVEMMVSKHYSEEPRVLVIIEALEAKKCQEV